MINTEDITIGTVLYLEDSIDPYGASYFMMMLIGRTDGNIIVKDYSQDGLIDTYSLIGSWETEYTITNIRIPQDVLKEQKSIIREEKLKRIIDESI